MSEPARNLNHAAVTEDLSEMQSEAMTGLVVNDELATANQRVLAILIDAVATGVLKGLLTGLFMAVSHKKGPNAAADVITNVVPLLYFVFMEFNNGQTLGKKIMKIRVVGDETEELGFMQVFGRETIGRFLTILPFGLGYLGAARRPDRKTFHDRIFNTRVIKVQ